MFTNKIQFVLTLVGILVLSGCETVQTETVVIGPSMGKSFVIPEGSYIDPDNHTEFQFFNLGSGVFQFKGPKAAVTDEDNKALRQIIAEMKPKNAREVQALQDFKDVTDRQHNVMQTNVTVATIDLDNGWFAAQITNVLGYSLKDKSYTPEKYELLIGSGDGSSLKFYSTSSCAEEPFLRTNGGGMKYDLNSKLLTNISSTHDLRNWLVVCINEKINKPSDSIQSEKFVKLR